MSGTVSLYEDDTCSWGLIEGDALMVLAKLPDHSVDAIVSDPPYGIDISGESWDGRDIRRAASKNRQSLGSNEAFECWTRVWAAEARRVLKPGGHLLAFGAPRTFHRLVSGIEDAGLNVRDQLLWLNGQGLPKSRRLPGGLGTALKPAYEPILLARAPLDGTTGANLSAWGTGALNIEQARVGEARYWPAHVTLSHDPACREDRCVIGCAVVEVDATPPKTPLSRLFYCAKASRAEREAGCEQLPARLVQLYSGRGHPPRERRNIHPTVKPISLMRWLIRLAVPPGGIVLDPFAGSGSTGIAAVLEGRAFLGIERQSDYVDVACARLTHWAHHATGGTT